MVAAFSLGVVLAFVVAQRAVLVDVAADCSDCRVQVVNLLDAQCLHRLDCKRVLCLHVIARVERPWNVRIQILFRHEWRHGCVHQARASLLQRDRKVAQSVAPLC